MQKQDNDRRQKELEDNGPDAPSSTPTKRGGELEDVPTSSSLTSETSGVASSANADNESGGNGLLTPSGTFRGGKRATRPRLQTKASTALSLTDIYTRPEHEGSPTARPSHSRAPPVVRTASFAERLASRRNSDAVEDNASIRSFRSTRSLAFEQEHGDTVESLLGDKTARLGEAQEHDNTTINDGGDLFTDLANEDTEFREFFSHEFDELEPLAGDGHNEGNTS